MSQRRRRVLLVLVVAAGSAAFLIRWRAAPARCRGCNVLLVTFDALRADRLGCYGYAWPTTAHLDALAARSMIFHSNMSQSGSTIASVPSIHTGKFPHADLLLADGVLREAERTLAEILRDAGWATGAVIAHEYARCRWGACQGFEITDDVYTEPEPADRTADRAVALMARLRPPFFVWVHVRHPHFPYDPPPDVFATMYGRDGPQPTFYSTPFSGLLTFWQIPALNAHYARMGERIQTVRLSGHTQEVTATVIRQLAAMYDGTVQEGDRVFGRLLEHLARRDEAGRTVVIVAADHGESLGNHGLIDHNLLWWEVLHTPLIVHVPGGPPGRSRRPTMNVDILPTILDIVGLPPPERIRGASVFAPQPHALQFAESTSSETVVRQGLRLFVGRGRQRRRVPKRLFDIATDPAEHHDLSSTRPEVVRELEGAIDTIRRHSLATDAAARDTDVEQKLRALGYIE